MIKIKNVKKSFGMLHAVNEVSFQIEPGMIFGLLGTNGAGKSTLLRMISGVLKADQGEILIEEENVFNNAKMKQEIFYISDEQFVFPNAALKDMEQFYSVYYPHFNHEKLKEYLYKLNLDENRKLNTFSKGMKKQASLLLGICSGASYLLCDETFDGLDPVMRQGMKSIFVEEMEERKFTPVIASHNLREIEDICDHIGILHEGGVILSKDMQDLKANVQKVQCVLGENDKENIYDKFDILQCVKRGKLISMVVRGEEKDIQEKLEQMNPVYYEILPLSLEEIFISEMEVTGYDIKKILF